MINEIIANLDSRATIIQRYIEAIELRNATGDKNAIAAIDKYLDELRSYQVDLLQGIKDGKEHAFDELLEVKDIRNFIYHYAWHIRKYFRFHYSEEDVVNEIKYQLFYSIKNNYRIYNQPNEFSLLINSMRRWIKQKVGNELKDTYRPKVDNFLPQLFIEDESYDGTETWVREVMDKILTDEDKRVFELRFFEGMGYKQIGIKMGKSKDAIQRRYEKILFLIKNYLEGIGKWQ